MQHLNLHKYVVVFYLMLFALQADAQALEGAPLVEKLQQGGLVLVMRHTNSPRELPDEATANPDNINGERQLDDKGRRDATSMGEALRRLEVPIGEVLSSPTYRALETARLAGLDNVSVQEELSNEGMTDSSAQYRDWLRTQAGYQPDIGNRLLITHGPNISAAFPDDVEGLEEGDMLVIDPEGEGGPVVIATIKSGDWATL